MKDAAADLDSPSTESCGRRASSVIRAIDVLSDPWSFLILRELFFGVRRFEELQGNLRIARNVLADRLARLVSEGVLARRQYAERPPRFEYRLAEPGRDFYPAIVALLSWGDRWRPSPGGPPLQLVHDTCQHLLDPRIVCGTCSKEISHFETEFEDGPGAGPESDLGPATRRRAGEDTWLQGRPCSVARTLGVIGDRWTLRILRESFLGVKRFDSLQRALGIARNILADRLSRLVDDGILEKREYQSRPARFEYALTPAGLDLYPAMLLFMAWGDKWRQTDEGAPLVVRHRVCGAALAPVLVCGHCGDAVRASDVSYRAAYVYPPAVAPD